MARISTFNISTYSNFYEIKHKPNSLPWDQKGWFNGLLYITFYIENYIWKIFSSGKSERKSGNSEKTNRKTQKQVKDPILIFTYIHFLFPKEFGRKFVLKC